MGLAMRKWIRYQMAVLAGVISLAGCAVVEWTYDVVSGTVEGAYYVTAGTAELAYNIGEFTFNVVKAPIEWSLMNEDIETIDGAPFQGDPRQVLRRHLERARDLGFTFFVAPEMEYFLFESPKPGGQPVPLDNGSYFELTTADVASDIRRRTLTTLEAMGIPVEYSFHEDAPSQHEIDLRYTDALTFSKVQGFPSREEAVRALDSIRQLARKGVDERARKGALAEAKKGAEVDPAKFGSSRWRLSAARQRFGSMEEIARIQLMRNELAAAEIAARTALGAVPPTWARAPAEPSRVSTSKTSSSIASLKPRRVARSRSARSVPASTAWRTARPTTSCASRNGTPLRTR